MNFAKSRFLLTTGINKSPNGPNVDAELVQLKSIFRLIFFCFIITLPLLTPGITIGFSSIALPQMELSLEETSWFGSLTSIACPIGCLCAGFCVDRWGRRTTLVCSIVPDVLGWFLLADENASLTQLYVGRLLTGFALGAASVLWTIYAAECITINHVRIRSSVGVWCSVSMSIGILLAYFLGAILPYSKVALVSASLSTVSLLCVLIFLLESPAWLYRKGRIGDAEIAQRRLGIKQPILQTRAEKVAPTISGPETVGPSFGNLLNRVRQVGRREVYKPLAISIGFLFFCQFSGLYCLMSYMVDIIDVRSSEIDPYVLTVISGVLQVVGGLLSVFMVPYCGVRALSIASFMGCAICFVVLALSVVFENSSAWSIFSHLHVISVWTVGLVSNMGLMTIPYSILAEIFPPEAKGLAGISLFASSVFNFIVLKIFPYMFAQYRNAVFFGFAGICACGSVFVATCLPETVGRTMDQIQEDFKRPKANIDHVGE